MHCRCFDSTWKGNHSSFLTPTVVSGRRRLPSEICTQSDWAPFEKYRLWQISAYNVSTVRDSKKVQLWQIGSWPQAFQWGIDGVRMLLLSPPKGGSKSNFFVFVWIKFNFSRMKPATEFLCMKIAELLVWICSEIFLSLQTAARPFDGMTSLT